MCRLVGTHAVAGFENRTTDTKATGSNPDIFLNISTDLRFNRWKSLKLTQRGWVLMPPGNMCELVLMYF